MTVVTKSNGFPRANRLLTPDAYATVFEKRLARRGRFFHLHLGNLSTSDIQDKNAPRIGIAVPKKLLKTAVHRNTIKRIARETFRQISPQLEIRDYVLRLSVKINPKKQWIDRSAIAEDIGRLFKPEPSRSDKMSSLNLASAVNKSA